MSKKDGFKISKKNFPGLVRVKAEDGSRIWMYKGKSHSNLKEMDMSVNPYKYFTKNINFKSISDDVTSTEDFVDVENEINESDK